LLLLLLFVLVVVILVVVVAVVVAVFYYYYYYYFLGFRCASGVSTHDLSPYLLLLLPDFHGVAAG
jgi:hypothetical protein